jgi:hypothetical protein
MGNYGDVHRTLHYKSLVNVTVIPHSRTSRIFFYSSVQTAFFSV